MLREHYQKYLAHHFALTSIEEVGKRVKRGVLRSSEGEVQIENFIPRFTRDSNYADSFGFQWNKFKSTQLDSRTSLSLSSDRFFRFTKWKPEELKGKEVLEVGCGAGRFTEIIAKTGANLVSVDYSKAVDACFENNREANSLMIQGDLFNLPFKKKSFDFVFCYGVLQHTPAPLDAFKVLTEFVRPGGKISVDNYVNRLTSPFCTPKYLWRPVTTKMNREKLLSILKFYIPLYLPFDTFVRKIPKIGPRILSLIPIPCWNYIDMGLSQDQRKEWAILDTFDALATTYDIPLDIKDFEFICRTLPIKTREIYYGSNGVVVNATL